MPTRGKQRAKSRLGLALFASADQITLTPCVKTRTGTLRPISAEELSFAEPEWHAVLAMCQAALEVRTAVRNLPESVREPASLVAQMVALFDQIDSSQVFDGLPEIVLEAED